jgi:hypothetical protein
MRKKRIKLLNNKYIIEVKLLWARLRFGALRNCVTAMRVTEVT